MEDVAFFLIYSFRSLGLWTFDSRAVQSVKGPQKNGLDYKYKTVISLDCWKSDRHQRNALGSTSAVNENHEIF